MLSVIGSKNLECLIHTIVTAICDSHPKSMSLYFRGITVISHALTIITALCAIESYGRGFYKVSAERIRPITVDRFLKTYLD